jgi:2-dehydro-3-deoxygluconokinase
MGQSWKVRAGPVIAGRPGAPLDTGIIPFRKATECQIHVSGGEFNVAANLADCFGMNTGIATAMVDYPIGDLIAERVRAMGVKPFYKHFEHDGVTGPNMATVYSDRGYGVRAPVVFYNRSNEAGALLKPGDFDWKAIFADGVRWFHSGGIFAALSPTTSELVIEGMQAARAAGAVVSFDLNYREKLWGARAAPSVRGRCWGASSRTWTCWWAMRRICRRAWGFRGPRWPPNRSSMPACFSA